MKIVLETIPVWDAFKKETECPICLLMEEAEKDGVSYYLSSAIMTPEVRLKPMTKAFALTISFFFPKEESPRVSPL